VAKATLKRQLPKAKQGRSANASTAKSVAAKRNSKPQVKAGKHGRTRPTDKPLSSGADLKSGPARLVPPNNNVISSPTTSDAKPRKNQAGFSSRELERFRELLLAKRGEIVGDMSSMEREALRSSGGSNLSTLPIHMADMGTDNYEQEFTLTLVETDRKLLRDINLALAKIQNGTFGICEGTGKPITKARLEVQPWARYSIEYAKKLERGGR
jgi:DnaK suppressor protein